MSGFTAYHDVDAATHQHRVDDLGPAGFRPVALNVSGQPGDPRYAAVWVARPGPAWQAVHGLPGGEYQARFDELTGHEGRAQAVPCIRRACRSHCCETL